MRLSSLLMIVVLLAIMQGCSSHREGRNQPRNDAGTPDPPAERLLVQSLKEELRSSQEMEAELADLVEAIRGSQNQEVDLLGLLGERLDGTDVLISCLRSIDQALDVAIENVSNAQTYGYKRIDVIFDGETIGHTRRIVTQGDLRRTDAPLDLAVQGRGFLQIEMPNGEIAYTRHGHFCRNAQGRITTNSGYELLDSVTVSHDGSMLKISEDGAVSIVRPDGVIAGQARIRLALFPHAEGLRSAGNTLFTATESSGVPIIAPPGTHGAGTLRQGFLERSNVNLMEELHNLHTLQRWKRGLEEAMLAIHRRKSR